jgi:hypothetical protein
MSDKKVEKVIKVLNELPVETTLKWKSNSQVIAKAFEAKTLTIHLPEIAREVGSELIWTLDPSKESGGWVFGDHKANLTINLPSIRKLVTKSTGVEVVNTVDLTAYDISVSGVNVWTVGEINAILGAWVYDLVNRSDLKFEYDGN